MIIIIAFIIVGDILDNIEEFIALDFSKQVHRTCLQWCKNNHESPYIKGRMNPKYFKCRAYLMKIPRQDIKNICIYLTDTGAGGEPWECAAAAEKYIRDQQIESEKKKAAALNVGKEYDLNLGGFLSD